MALENDTPTEIEKSEKDLDFSGNYIEKFGKQDTRDQFPGFFKSWEKIGNRYIFHNENSSLELTVVTDDILKFRYGNFGYFEDDFSYGLDPSENFDGISSKFKETKELFRVATKTVICYIYKDSLKTKITDTKDVTIVEDEKGYHWQDEKVFGGNVVITTKKLRKVLAAFGHKVVKCATTLSMGLSLWMYVKNIPT